MKLKADQGTIEMVVQFEFSTAYASLLGEKTVQVALDGDQATVTAVVEELFKSTPKIKEVLLKNNLVQDNRLIAMLLWNTSILDADSFLADGAVIKVLSPICGG
jgi:molybdopterin converting factor small subunit